MKYYLLKMIVNGVKNIDKSIELLFYRKTLTRNFDPSGYNVKAIYGANGAGKTALIYAAEIYKKFVLNKDYLALYNSNSSLLNLINQTTKQMSIEMEYAVLSDNYVVEHIFSHGFSLVNVNGRYQIKNEELRELTGLRLNDDSKWKTIYKVIDGELIDNEDSLLVEISKNVLFDRSVVSNVVFYQSKNNKLENILFNKILYTYYFAQNITVLLNSIDKNYINYNYITKQVETLSKYRKEMEKTVFAQLLLDQSLLNNDEIPVEKSNYESFEKWVKKLCIFLQVFKTNLKDLEIKKEEKGEEYNCNIIFLYNDGKKIARQYESAGIKKLMNIYFALCNIEYGGIVFIDEFDANIHDVVLLKIVDYVRQYTKGQFVFSTHNLGPMEVLQKDKCSIDFLSDDSRITSWRKIGNCSAASVYRKGLIKYSPFNIEAFSFLGVFGDGSDK